MILAADDVAEIIAGDKTAIISAFRPQPRVLSSGAYSLGWLRIDNEEQLRHELLQRVGLWFGTQGIKEPYKILEARGNFISVAYKAGGRYTFATINNHLHKDACRKKEGTRWLPPMSMKTRYIRLWLLVTDIDVFRLHELSRFHKEEYGIIASTAKDVNRAFELSWDYKIRKRRKSNREGFLYKDNPWVFIARFVEKCLREELYA